MASHDFTPVGAKFSRLTVIGAPFKLDARRNAKWHVQCRCECGRMKSVMSLLLVTGHTKSCGCYRGRKGEQNLGNRKHGLSHGVEWAAYYEMLRRCNQEHHPQHKNYGGRGIKVCDRWAGSFESFYADMGPRPDGTTLDRIEVDGNYEPGNCRWATPAQQANNRRSNRYVEAFGETLTVSEWSARKGIASATIIRRLNKGWPAEKALTAPLTPRADRHRISIRMRES